MAHELSYGMTSRVDVSPNRRAPALAEYSFHLNASH